MSHLHIELQTFDIPREVSVYPDKFGVRWWTKAWFNKKKRGEKAVSITLQQAISFIQDNIDKDEWLEKYYPKQMDIYHRAIEQTRQQILNQSIL